ncbi:coiled-coil-helix-coiled-coil-helix domain containing 3a isoform X2 [Festucalex cinctus]
MSSSLRRNLHITARNHLYWKVRSISLSHDEKKRKSSCRELSENVINRMREPSMAPRPQPVAAPPPFDPISSTPPPLAPPATASVAPPPLQPEQVEAPPFVDMVLPSSSSPTIVPPAFEPSPAPTPAPPPPAVEPVTALFPSPSDPPVSAPFPAAVDAITPRSEPLSPPAFLPPDSDPITSLPVSEPVTVLPTPSPQSQVTTPPPPPSPPSPPPPPPPFQQVVESESCAAVPERSSVAPPPVAPTIDEEALKKRISDELYEGLEKQRVKAEEDLQAWLEAEKSRASAQAQAEAKRHVEDEVSRILSAERAVVQESVQQAVIRERIAAEDEKLRTQLYAKKLEAKEADLNKQDAFYREQLARLEERSAQFYKVTTENYHKAADQVNAKFKRYDTYPVCTDLQGQILACYQENAGKTLHCSNIAAMYLQCVNNAKQKNKHAASRTEDVFFYAGVYRRL